MYNNYKESALYASSMAHAMSEVNDTICDHRAVNKTRTCGGDELWRVTGTAKTVWITSAHNKHVRSVGTQVSDNTRRLRRRICRTSPALQRRTKGYTE